MTSDDGVTNLERGVLAVHAVCVRSVAELHEEQVAELGVVGAELADGVLHFMGVAKKVAACSLVVVLATHEHGESTAIERFMLAICSEVVDAFASEGADEVVSAQCALRIVEHATSSSEEPSPQLGRAYKLFVGQELEIG